MRSIIETCKPRDDIRSGSFNPEVFTASLGQVLERYRGLKDVADGPYTDPVAFFCEATHPTDGMKMVVSDVFRRIAGDNTAPAIHRLETAFGGGKTHTLIALTHLAFQGNRLSTAVTPLFGALPLLPPDEVAVAGVAGDELAVHKPKGKSLVPYTLWGEIAAQIGGDDLYRRVEEDAASFAAPGKSYFETVFGGRKALVMLDELAQYAARLAAAHPDGADQLAAFLMSLHGYARTHSGVAVVVTLASQSDAFGRQSKRLAELLSQVTGKEIDENTIDTMAAKAEAATQSVVARDATTVVPVQASEISMVLAKRLFVDIDRAAAAEAAKAYSEMYVRNSGMLPDEATRDDYAARIERLYPFHPTFIDFLTQKLSTVETFQGTRGVLRVLALSIRNLWGKHARAPMMHACHLDMRDARTVNEIVGRTGASQLLAVLNTDVGGPDTGTLAGGISRAELSDRKNRHPDGWPLHEYTWRTVFLHSLVGRSMGLGTHLFGITLSDALLATAFPGMTPPQVETALTEIENSAFYLRHNQGRWYASLDPSINRALASIRDGLSNEPVADLLAATARKVVARDNGTFEVSYDVLQPEHVPEARGRPALAIIAIECDSIDADAFITTIGPNRPRTNQNNVFLLVPEIVHVKGEVWNEDRTMRSREQRGRLDDLARTVIAMRTLADKPQNWGINQDQLNTDGFDRKFKERGLALLTAVTQLYNAIWFPASGGQVAGKPVRTGGGEGGVPVVAEIRNALKKEGEMLDAETVGTQETALSLARLFFVGTNDAPLLKQLRDGFAINRRWPVLDDPGLFDSIVRSGVSRGVWCLFRMGGEDRIRPEEFYSREAGDVPFGIDLSAPDFCLVTVDGANKRGWGPKARVDEAKVQRWVADAISASGSATVAEVARAVVAKHGDVPEATVLNIVGELVRDDKVFTRAADGGTLVHGHSAIMHTVTADHVLMTPAEAARQGLVRAEDVSLNLRGEEAAKKLMPIFRSLGGMYAKGAKSKIDLLDVYDMELASGGKLRIQITNASAADMKRLDELFQVLSMVAKLGPGTEAEIEISGPEDGCTLVAALKNGK